MRGRARRQDRKPAFARVVKASFRRQGPRGFQYNSRVKQLLGPALLSAALALAVTPLVARLARRLGAVDRPGGRRIHRQVTPRLGGAAVMIAFFVTLLAFLPDLAPHFKEKQLAGFALAAVVIFIFGVIDDRRGVPASVQLAVQVFCGLVLVAVGMGVDEVTNPISGGLVQLDWLTFTQTINGIDYQLNLPADLLTVAWVVLVMNAVNWLDAADGISSGVGIIGALTIALLALSPVVNQPHVAVLATILAGSLAGFLVYNWHPARIFQGFGPMFIGFTLATLAIISGGKVATALLVLGLPILDALAVIMKRLLQGGRSWAADTSHLPHLLLARGFSQRQTALIIYALSAAFGALALFTQTTGQKLLAFVVLVGLMSAVLVWLARPAGERSRQ